MVLDGDLQPVIESAVEADLEARLAAVSRNDAVKRRPLVADAVRRLADAGVASPEADAEILLAHVLGIDRSRLVLVDEVARR